MSCWAEEGTLLVQVSSPVSAGLEENGCSGDGSEDGELCGADVTATAYVCVRCGLLSVEVLFTGLNKSVFVHVYTIVCVYRYVSRYVQCVCVRACVCVHVRVCTRMYVCNCV